MSSLTISLVVFACVFCGGLLGTFVHSRLPEHHLGPETRDTVRLGMGLVATTVALVLGLLIASAKSFYDTQNTEVTQLAANVVVLDRLLAHFGPEANEARAALHNSAAHFIDRLWPEDNSVKADLGPVSAGSEVILDLIQNLAPKTDGQRSLQAQAQGLAIRHPRPAG